MPFGVLFGARERIGVNDQRTPLALADTRVQSESLLEGHPTWRSKAVLDDGAPQHQNIDAGVRFPVMAQRTSDPAGSVFSAPRLHPWVDDLCKETDDFR